MRINKDEYKQELIEECKKRNLIVLSFSGTKHKYSRFKCNNCNKEFDDKPIYIFEKNHHCPRCVGGWSPRRITTEDYKDDIKYMYGDRYTILGEYENNKKKILTRCNICLHEWEIRPNDLLSNNHGCPECAKVKISKSLSKPIEEYTEDIMELSNNRYNIINDKIICNNCNNSWNIENLSHIKYLLTRNNDTNLCSECNNVISKHTPESINKRLKEIYNDDYEVQDDFIDVNTSCSIKHIKCGTTYNARPGRLLYKNESLCPCTRNNSRSKAEDEIIEYIKTLYNGEIVCNTRSIISPYEIDIYLPDIKVAIEYNSLYWHSRLTNENINEDIHQYKSILCYNKGIRLIQIFDNQWKKSTNLMKVVLKDIINNPSIYISNSLQWGIPINQDLVTINKPRKIYLKYSNLCKKNESNNYTYTCGTFNTMRDKFDEILNNLSLTYSVKEINKHNLSLYYIKDRKEVFIYVNPKEINLKNNYTSNYLNILRDKLLKKNYNPIFIFTNDLININIIESKIKHILKLNNNKRIYARNCIVKEINTKQKSEFLKNNHIQGNDSANIKLGLFYENKLVSVMTFCKPRISLGFKDKSKYDYELSRFTYDINYNIVGGFSKLFKYFERNYEWKKIVTYADKKYSTGNVYIKNNWKFSHESQPSYNYIDLSSNELLIEPRFKYRKNNIQNILGNIDDFSNKTERQILSEFDKYQFYNLGNYVFEYSK